jgi:hypothetical protein
MEGLLAIVESSTTTQTQVSFQIDPELTETRLDTNNQANS